MNKQELENIQRYVADDEIDLVDLFMIVWKRKWMIVAVTVLLTVAAAGISYLMPKVYEVSAILEPGKDEDGKVVVSSQTVRENILGGTYDQKITTALNLDGLPKFKVSIPKQTNLLKVSMESSNPEVAVRILEKIISDIKEENNSQMHLKKQFLENDVKMALSESEKYPRLIKSLEMLIQRSIKEIDSLEKAKNETLSGTEDNSISLLLYLNEIRNQQFLLSSLNEKLENLKVEKNKAVVTVSNLRLKLAAIKPLTVNKPPRVSNNPVKPNKKLIVALAFILGLMGGIMLAFGAEFMTKVKQQQAKENH